MAGNTVWVLILKDRHIDDVAQVYASEESAIAAARAAIKAELDHWKLEKPDQEKVTPNSKRPYWATTFDDGLHVDVVRAEVLA